ncbi:MAG: SufD family Fe-S cluster assembly protein [Lachnospiraceae bacterium]|nr:SufD family Fe-S cluster assembly protein [Lachnospiraceae bacterium]
MEKSRLAVVNALPAPTYRFLKVNESGLSIPESVTTYPDTWDQAALPQGIDLRRIARFDDLPEACRLIETGMGSGIDRALSEQEISCVMLTAAKGTRADEPIVLPVTAACGSTTIAEMVICAEENSEITVILDMTGDDGGCAAVKSFFGLSTRIRAEKNAQVRLIHVQRFGASITSFDDIGAWCDERASFALTTLLLGSRRAARGYEGSFIGARATLAGEEASFTGRTGYYCAGQMSLDMNFVADHREKKTNSEMIFRGVLDDHAAKTWRGTLDFKSGAAGSVGDEQEDTLMLSPDIRNSSVPVILCGEEDVDGRHGATIGQISEEILFYMRSRGYTEEEARRLIVQARLKSIAREIPENRLRWEVEQWIEKEIG